jgi:Protein of unknown function (DUF3987)
VPFLRFDAAAQELFDGWRADLEQRLRAEDEHPVLLSHLAKYRSLMPSLALILHLIDGVDAGVGGPVSGVAAERAAAWCRYLEAHARRLYATVTDRVRVAAALLASRDRSRAAGEPVYRPRGLPQRLDRADGAPCAGEALECLRSMGWPAAYVPTTALLSPERGRLEVMISRRTIACLVLLTIVLFPVLGIAGDDFSGFGRGVPRETGLRHQPLRPWRTIPGALEPPFVIPRMVPLAALDASEPAYTLPVVVRTPFVPPRG